MESLHAARVICRILIPDSLLQYFTVQRASKKTSMKKRLLPVCYPNIYGVLVGQIIKKSGMDFDKAISSLSRHIAKCSDRRPSRSLRQLEVEIAPQDADTCSVTSTSSSASES